MLKSQSPFSIGRKELLICLFVKVVSLPTSYGDNGIIGNTLLFHKNFLSPKDALEEVRRLSKKYEVDIPY